MFSNLFDVRAVSDSGIRLVSPEDAAALLSARMDQASQQDFPNCLGLSPDREAGALAPCHVAIRHGCGWGEAPLLCARLLALGLVHGGVLLLCLKKRAHRGFREMADHPVSTVLPARNKGKSWIQLTTGETTVGFGQRSMDESRPELVAMLLREPRGSRAPKGGEGRRWSTAVLPCIQRPGVTCCQKSHSCLKNHTVNPQ